jgi:6-pyruvoyltetrahydropterin/6-carboxytetrahydropterin synthase
MKTSVTKRFTFEAGHQLTDSYTEACQHQHGHGYKLFVTFEGDIQENGMVMDFKLMKKIVQPIVDYFDHNFFTKESFAGKNPTAENMCVFIFDRIREKTSLIKKVQLWETEDSYAEISY